MIQTLLTQLANLAPVMMSENVVEGIAAGPRPHLDSALACANVLRPVAFDPFAVAASAALDICSVQVCSAPFLVCVDVELRYGPSEVLWELGEAVGIEPFLYVGSIVTCYVVRDEHAFASVAVDQRRVEDVVCVDLSITDT